MTRQLLALSVLLTLAACGGSQAVVEPEAASPSEALAESAPAPTANTPENAVFNEYAPEVQQAFMEECVGAGGPESVCGCVLTAMQYRYSEADLANNAVDEVWLDEATVACLEPLLQETAE